MLDLFFASNPSLIKNLTTIPGISDHHAIITDSFIRPSFNIKRKRKIFNFNKADWPSLQNFCENLSSSLILRSKDYSTLQLWDLFKSTLELGISQFVPSKFVKNRHSLPWINKNLIKLVKKKTKLFKLAKESGNWSDYKSHQKLCKKEFRAAESDYINKTINEGPAVNNPKPFWRFVKSRKCDNLGVSALKKKGHLHSDAKKKADILLDQFCSVFTSDDDDSGEMPQVGLNIKDNISDIVIDPKGVEKLLSSLQPHKAAGPDMIPNIANSNTRGRLLYTYNNLPPSGGR